MASSFPKALPKPSVIRDFLLLKSLAAVVDADKILDLHCAVDGN
jgi:hypothetical protein